MENESILFQPISGEKEALSAVRKAFRVPVADSSSVQVFWGEKICSVLNISQGGISVVFDDTLDVQCDQVCGGWELRLGPIRFQNLTARVIHCASMASGQLICGIQWIDLGEAEISAINEAVVQMKARALGNNDRTILQTQDDEND